MTYAPGMNRAERRRLKAKAPDSVTLRGGPMDGWVVKPDAPALRPDWHRTWPRSVSSKWSPGRYVREGREARWQEGEGA